MNIKTKDLSRPRRLLQKKQQILRAFFECCGTTANRAPSTKTILLECPRAAAIRALSAKTTPAVGMTVKGKFFEFGSEGEIHFGDEPTVVNG